MQSQARQRRRIQREEGRSSVAREPIKKITLKSGEVRYRFVTDAPRGPDGKRRQVTHTFDTLREARDALAKIRTESSTGRYVHPDKTTLDEYLSEWLAAIGRGVEPGTLRAYQDALRLPRELLGHRKLQSINSADVNAVIEFMLTKGRKKGGPADTGLGPRSVQMMLTVLRRAFQEAVRDRKMTWNPAEGVRGPRLRPRKVTPWTDDEVRAFMDAARRDRLHAIWRLSLLALPRGSGRSSLGFGGPDRLHAHRRPRPGDRGGQGARAGDRQDARRRVDAPPRRGHGQGAARAA